MHGRQRSMGRKASNQWVVLLRTTHHHALHAAGSGERWWKERRVNPILAAERYWQLAREVGCGENRREGQVNRAGSIAAIEAMTVSWVV